MYNMIMAMIGSINGTAVEHLLLNGGNMKNMHRPISDIITIAHAATSNNCGIIEITENIVSTVSMDWYLAVLIFNFFHERRM